MSPGTKKVLNFAKASVKHAVRVGSDTIAGHFKPHFTPSASSGTKQWLHGLLTVTIYEAKDLPNPDRLGTTPKVIRKLIEGVEQILDTGPSTSDCYVNIELPPARVARTSVIHNTTHPHWHESFSILCAHQVSEVVFTVKENNFVGAVTLGKAMVGVMHVLAGAPLDGWFAMCDDKQKMIPSQIRVKLQFFPAQGNPMYSLQSPRGALDWEVPRTYFHLQKCCRMTPYHNAHVPLEGQPAITLGYGQQYQPGRCWDDIYKTIYNAQQLVYVIGWSISRFIRLIRDPALAFTGSDMTFGELLKWKADQGLLVCILVWDDRTSRTGPLGLSMTGVMNTMDEETNNYFKKSNVNCILCPRNPASALSKIQSLKIGTFFSHHQKAIVTDVPGLNPQLRRLTAFVGGIDITQGRYDTADAPLFKTLTTVHKDDFFNHCFPNTLLAQGGPREPWNDIHCHVDGPVAWDVLHNFETRWRKQAPEQGSTSTDLKDLRDPAKFEPPLPVTAENDPEMWMCQVLRSIDSSSVVGFPTNNDHALQSGLTTSKGNVIDHSMQDGWIHAIRRSQRFIYIESQYFLGSCFAWDADVGCGCSNLVPIEIALKIVSKIREGEAYSAYVVLPMFPEGVPDSAAVQAILFWQWRTMSMMYRMISEALETSGVKDRHPTDYLRFFCLGTRESPSPDELAPTEKAAPNSFYARAQASRRFMIYVHSKMLLVDDEYVIIGSANINQRSMDGARDTEIACAAFQPVHTWATRGGPPRGQVHGFRMSIWARFSGHLEDVFLEPWSLQCSRRLGEIGASNWQTYMGPDALDMPGHLIAYPLQINADGTVAALTGMENIPDTSGPLLGSKSSVLPDLLTT